MITLREILNRPVKRKPKVSMDDLIGLDIDAVMNSYRQKEN